MTKSSKRLKYIFSVLFLSLFSLVFLNGKVFAAEEVETKLQISPVEDRMSLDPGAVYKNNFTIVNKSEEEKTFEIDVLPFQVEKETYKPIFNVKNSYTQITNWIETEADKYTLEPGEAAIIYYTITVPKDAPGGGQYAAISVTTRNATGDRQSVSVDASINYVISARLSGTTRETGEIVDVRASGFLLAPPIKSSVKLTNTGNVDTAAKITVDIENAITGAKLYTNSDSPKESYLLPETEKTVEMQFDNILRLGVMRLTMRVEYLDDVQIFNRIVVICPIWFIIIFVSIIVILVARIMIKKRENSKKRSNSRGFEKPGNNNFNI